MAIDPFSLKSHSKLSPRRIAFTVRARALDYVSRLRFEASAIPAKLLPDLPVVPDGVAWDDTSVTTSQMQHLIKALQDTEAMGGCVIEVGSFRGVTTRCLAAHTTRQVISVDPFIGYGASESDFAKFQKNTGDVANIAHVRATSGAAAAAWQHGPASLVFIDAVHDYVNTSFDIDVWWPVLMPGGIMALHDTDDPNFPGTRRAAHELLEQRATLYAQPRNITLVRKGG